MTGRGVDQIMRHPSNPLLHERVAKSALRYVELAKKKSGPIPRGVAPDYIWGDVLAELDRLRPDARIVNLETAVTTSDAYWIGKTIHYRMHPANIGCLTAARIDCCTLANNHVLDWAYVGLRETIASLRAAGIKTAGAGDTLAEARKPAVITLPSGQRVLVVAYGSQTSGVPNGWAATNLVGGINGLNESDPGAVGRVADAVNEVKRPGDLVVVSIHWGTNWGYEVTSEQRQLARGLIDEAGVDLVYGHSSHHPRPIEVYRGKLVLYGCGDFINDYEGISGHDTYRPELGFMYVPTLAADGGRLLRLVLVPTRIEKLRVNRARAADVEWLAEMLNREGRSFGTRVQRSSEGYLELNWT